MPLFDQLRGGVDRAKFEANKAMRVNTAQSELGALKTQMAGRRDELGAAVFALFKAGQLTEPDLVKICEAMVTLETNIAAKDKEIESIRAEVAPTAPPPAPAAAPATPSRSVAAPAPAPSTAGGPYGHICPTEKIPVPAGAAFCPSCGARAIDVPPPAAPAPAAPAQQRTCPNCNNPVAPNAGFCPNCGTKLT